VGISFVTVRDRPDLVRQMWDLPTPWPTFMQQDVVSDLTYDLMPVRYPEYQLLAVDGDRVRARVNAVPYAWSGVDDDLPENGWDFALGMAFRPEMPGPATAVCLIEARIHPDQAGSGLGSDLVRTTMPSTSNRMSGSSTALVESVGLFAIPIDIR